MGGIHTSSKYLLGRINMLLFALLAVVSAEVYFKETFDDTWAERWVESDWKKDSGEQGEWEHTAGEWYGDAEASKGLKTTQDARFYSISAKIPEPFSNKGKDLVIQYQVRFPQKIDCGGGYLKLMPSTQGQKEFDGESDYNIMFGPDICGYSTKKVHAIFSYNGQNKLIKKDVTAETDQVSHVYTFIVKPDNTYEILVDGDSKQKGKLEDDWDLLEPRKIKDPEQSKPEDWVDDAKMDDPEDEKPEGWDDVPKEIDNPDFVEDDELYAYEDFGLVGIDVWQVKSGTIFDNIIITDNYEEAKAFMEETYTANKDAEKEMFDAAEKARREKEEADRKKEEEERKAREAEEEEEDEDEDEEEAEEEEE